MIVIKDLKEIFEYACYRTGEVFVAQELIAGIGVAEIKRRKEITGFGLFALNIRKGKLKIDLPALNCEILKFWKSINTV